MSTVENPEGRNVKPLKTRSDTTHKSQQLTHRRRRVKKIHPSFMHGFMGPVTCVPGEQTGCRALTPVTPGDSVGVASVGTDTPDLFPVQNIFFYFFEFY